jgi:hypothetical protein
MTISENALFWPARIILEAHLQKTNDFHGGKNTIEYLTNVFLII